MFESTYFLTLAVFGFAGFAFTIGYIVGRLK